MCKSWCELIIGLVIAIFAIFLWNWMYTQWVIAIVAIVLIIHSFVCKNCWYRCDGEVRGEMSSAAMPMKKPKKRKRR